MSILKLGRFLFAISVAAFGFQHFILDNYISPGLGPESATTLVFSFLGFFFRISLITLSLAIIFVKRPRVYATFLGVLILIWMAFRHLPLLVTHIHDPAEWNFMCMALAMGGSAFIVAASFREKITGYENHYQSAELFHQKIVVVGKFLYGIPMIVFGAQHLRYADFIASMIPSWIAGNHFWALVTGIALIGSGISILFNLLSRWVTPLLGIMIFLWIILIHLPRIIANPVDSYQWTSAFQAMALSASAFIFMENLQRQKLSSKILTEFEKTGSSRPGKKKHFYHRTHSRGRDVLTP